MTDTARLHLPKIRPETRRCLTAAPGRAWGIYCTRAHLHGGRHVATFGARRVVVEVWA